MGLVQIPLVGMRLSLHRGLRDRIRVRGRVSARTRRAGIIEEPGPAVGMV